MSDMLERFWSRFAALAEERLARAALVAREARHGEALAVAADLHSMAGEAGLLGLPVVFEAARAGEAAAKRMHSGRADAEAKALAAALTDLERAIAAVGARAGNKEGRTS